MLPGMKKIADFCDVEIYMDGNFEGKPSAYVNYLDDDEYGEIDLESGTITGNFSKYVLPVIEAWLKEHRDQLLLMWREHRLEALPAWE